MRTPDPKPQTTVSIPDSGCDQATNKRTVIKIGAS
jgi:hypothetical protein